MNFTIKSLNSNFDNIIAILFFIILSTLLIILKLKNVGYLYILPLLLAILLSVLWLIIRGNASLKFNLSLPGYWNKLNLLCIFLLVIINIFVLYSRPDSYQRPLTYFIIMSLISGLIFVSILISDIKNEKFILLIIILLGLANSWSESIIFSTVIGIDPWYHQFFTNLIIETGSIKESLVYSKFPIFHLIVAETSIITGENYRTSSMFSTSLIQIIGNIILIYLISFTIFNNYKISLISALMVAVANNPIQLGFMSIPNGLSTIFVLLVVLLIFDHGRNNYLAKKCLILLFMLVLILTHPIGSVFLFLILLTINISSYLYTKLNYGTCKKNQIKNSLIINSLFLISILSYWMYVSGTFKNLGYAISWGFRIDRFMKAPLDVLETSRSLIPQSEMIFNYLGLIFFCGLSFTGIFYMISSKSNRFAFATAFSSFMLIALSFIPILTGQSLLQQRWWYLSQLLLSIPLAVSFYIYLYHIKNKYIGLGFISSLIVLMTFIMLISNNANIDNNSISPNSNIRYSLIDSEVSAATKIHDVWNDNVSTDFYYGTAMSYFLGIEAMKDISENLFKKDFKINNPQVVIIRDAILTRSFMLFVSTFKLDYDPRILLDMCRYSKIYDNNQASGWLSIQSAVQEQYNYHFNAQ